VSEPAVGPAGVSPTVPSVPNGSEPSPCRRRLSHRELNLQYECELHMKDGYPDVVASHHQVRRNRRVGGIVIAMRQVAAVDDPGRLLLIPF